MNTEALTSQDKPRPKNRIGVIICEPTWLKTDEKIRNWIKDHPNEKIVGRIPIVFCVDSGRNCGGLMVERDEESLPSDF